MYHFIMRFSLLLLAASLLLTTQSAKAVSISRSTAPPPLGTNLDVAADWITEIPFIDVFKLSRPWMPTSARFFDTGEADLLELDPSGWVTSLPAKGNRSTEYDAVQTVMFTKAGTNYPDGLYTVLYEGEGTIEYLGDAKLTHSEDGRDIIEVTPGATDGGIIVKITETDPAGTGDYIRNIQMLLPGFTAEQAENDIFNPEFLASVDEYSVIRFMNWLRVNYVRDWQSAADSRSQASVDNINPLDQLRYDPALRAASWNEPLLWAERPLVTDARYSTEKGVPVEIIAALVNTIDADVWLNIPHQVDEYYVWNYATLMQDELEWDKQVYLEYSNEIWNTGFGQGEYVEQQATQEGIQAANVYEARLKWYASRSASLCNVWKDTWEDTNDQHRVTCLINSPATQPDKIDTMLACDHWQHAPCYKHLDAVAIAPYFGQHIGQPVHLPTLRQWSAWDESGLDYLYDEIRYGGELSDAGNISPASLPDVYENITSAVNIVGGYYNQNGTKLKLIAYEGGQHLVGLASAQGDDELNTLFTEFNANWRMGKLYADYLAKWNELGGGVFVHYRSTSTYSEWGYWGAQEYMGQTNSEKMKAIEAYRESFIEPPPPVLSNRVFIPIVTGMQHSPNWVPFSVPMPEAEREAEAAMGVR